MLFISLQEIGSSLCNVQMLILKYFAGMKNLIRTHIANKYVCENANNRFSPNRIDTNHQFVKSALSAWRNKTKHGKSRYVIISERILTIYQMETNA